MAQVVEKVKVYVYRNTDKNKNEHYLYPMTVFMPWMVPLGEVEATLSYDDENLEKDSDAAEAKNILAELEQERENFAKKEQALIERARQLGADI